MLQRALFLLAFAPLLAAAAAEHDASSTYEPAAAVYRACNESSGIFGNALDELHAAGWLDVTTEDRFRAISRDVRFIETRAKLTRAYPDEWDDQAVSRAYPSTMAATIDELVDRMWADIRRENFHHWTDASPDAYLFQAVLEHGHDSSEVVLASDGRNSFLNCTFVGLVEDNPTLVAAVYSVNSAARKKQAVTSRHIIGWKGAGVTWLGEYAKQDDDRFPIQHDLSMFMSMRRQAQ